MRGIPLIAFLAVMIFTSCAKKENVEATDPSAQAAKPTPETSAPAESAGGPHAFVHLKNGGRVPGTIVASSKTDMVVAGDDGIEHKIPLSQVKSVEYGEGRPAQTAAAPVREPVRPNRAAKQDAAPQQQTPPQTARETAASDTATPAAPAPPPPPKVTTRTYELPAGTELSVRTNELIDSETASEGQTFDAQVTRDATDANGDVVIPRGSQAWVVIRSASKGGRFRGSSDLVLDLQSVVINEKRYTIETADVTKQGRSGVGANRRTAEYTGGGAALGAIIGAIAGGGKGAAIGAGAGAGAGALTQILTKGRSIKVPAESVLTFKMDKSLKVNAAT
jgi:hypothetical protein